MAVPPQFQKQPGEKVPARVAKKAKARRVPKRRAVLAAFERATGSKKKPKPNPNAKLGQGGRFAAVRAQAAKSGARDPDAVAAAAGRKKYGAAKMQQLAAKGRR